MSKVSAALRRLRNERSLTQDQLGEAVRLSGSSIASFETGRAIPVKDTARRFDDFFGTGSEVVRAADEDRRDARPLWFRPWEEIEERASMLRYYQTSLIPGLLQTEEYARTVLDNGVRTQPQVEELLAARMARQSRVLERADQPLCAFVLDSGALRCGTPEVTRGQLRHLLDLGERPHLPIQVVPASAGMHAGRSGAFSLATVDCALVGFEDGLFKGHMIGDPVELTGLDQTWQAVGAVALPRSQSRDLIAEMVNEL